MYEKTKELSPEEKLQAVKKYLSGEGSTYSIAYKYEINIFPNRSVRGCHTCKSTSEQPKNAKADCNRRSFQQRNAALQSVYLTWGGSLH